ncbi:amidohydrolase [Mycoplasma sp. P36-A1]|uniref:amidohydrolase n=1 Tax=Mycoplasma sp. P36-A1 TaxID=3252900 RepID=UPI003C3093E8
MFIKEAIQHYKYLHQFPELSNNEIETTKYILKELETIPNISIEKVDNNALIVTLNPNKKLTVAFRADTDALEIEENTQLPYSSKNEGVMHACGHDFHTANLIVFIKYLAQQTINYTAKFIFQPNEETTPGGSVKIIQSKLVDDVDHFISLHVEPTYKVGQVLIKKGDFYASTDDFSINLKGVGAHICTPDLGIDSLPPALNIATYMPSTILKRLNPLKLPLIAISSFTYGANTHNVIHESANIKGSIRAHDQEIRANSRAYLEQYVESIASTYQVSSKVEWQIGEPPLHNDETLSEDIVNYINNTQDKLKIEYILDLNYGGEDFSNYAVLKPSAYFIIGTHTENNYYDLHSDGVIINLEAFNYSLELFKQISNYFNQKAPQ